MRFLESTPVFLYLAVITSSLSIISCGMFIGWPSPSLPQLLGAGSYLPLTNDEGSWIAAVFLIGGICGSLLAGLTMDKFGRKNVLLFSSLPFIASWLMVAYAGSFEVLLAARFLAGIPDGLVYCGTCIYLTEISEPAIRGLVGSSITVSNLFGVLLANIIGSYMPIRGAALVSLTFPVLFLLSFIWMPESPYHLIMKGDMEKAKGSLEKFRGSSDVEKELVELTKVIQKQNKEKGKFLDLITVSSNRRSLLIIVALRTAQQWTGTIPIMFYAQTVFQEAGSGISASHCAMIYFAVQMLVALFSTVIVDRTGRKPLIIISLLGISLALLVEGCFFCVKNNTNIETGRFVMVSVVGLIAFATMDSVGMQTIPLLLVGEVFPTNVKAYAVSFSDVHFCVVSTAASKFFQFSKDHFGLEVPLFVFCACAVLGLVFTALYIPETKGKTLEQIQEELAAKSGKKELSC